MSMKFDNKPNVISERMSHSTIKSLRQKKNESYLPLGHGGGVISAKSNTRRFLLSIMIEYLMPNSFLSLGISHFCIESSLKQQTSLFFKF
jgi:hypothetical protein